MDILMSFDEFNLNENDKYLKIKKLMNSKTNRFFMKLISILDDLVHFDFSNIKRTLKNKEIFNRILDATIELSYVIGILKKEKITREEDIFKILYENKINSKRLLYCLERPDIKEYIDKDNRLKKRLEKNKDTIELVKRYENWKKDSKLEWWLQNKEKSRF